MSRPDQTRAESLEFSTNSHGEFEFSRFAPAAPKVDADAMVEIEVGEARWSVPARNVLAAVRLVSEGRDVAAELEALSARRIA